MLDPARVGSSMNQQYKLFFVLPPTKRERKNRAVQALHLAWRSISSTEKSHMLNRGEWMVLAAAFISFLFSISLWFGFGIPVNKEAGIFVGLWVPSILATGIFVQQAIRVRRDG
jgi:hypothetical protein